MSQVEKLWDSILQDYPISNFLFWKIDENNVSEDTNFCYFLKDVCFNNAKQPKSANYELFGVSFEKTDTAVLDGQQRLTSLYLSLLGNAEILAKHAHNHKNGIRSKLVIELNQNKLDVEEEGYNSKKYDIRFTDKTGLLSPTQFEIRKLMELAFQSENYRNSEFEKIIAMVPSESKQSEDDTTTIAITIDKDTRRNRHQEVTEISGYLDERGMGDTDMQSILEVLVEHIQNGTSEAPQEEEQRD